MKKLLFFLFIITIGLFLYGCQQNMHTDEENKDTGEGKKMDQKNIYDFKHIDKAPEATEKQAMDKVIKVFFDESTFDKPYEAVAIDIENNEVYANPIIGRRGLRAQDGIVKVNETAKVLDILDNHEVQTWDKKYSSDANAYEDGYSWQLLLQYEDGTVEKYEGNEEDEVPTDFNKLAKELRDFADEKIEEK